MKKFICLLSVICLFVSCTMWSQIEQTAALQNCKFNLKNVENVSIAGVNIKNLTHLTSANIVTLTTALLNKKIPLHMAINIDIKNPGNQTAALNGMDWIFAIDDQDFISGEVSQKYTIPAQSNISMPLDIKTDIYTLFSQNGIDAVKNFINSFSKTDGTSSRIAIKIKPSIYIGNIQVKYPNYISLEKSI